MCYLFALTLLGALCVSWRHCWGTLAHCRAHYMTRQQVLLPLVFVPPCPTVYISQDICSSNLSFNQITIKYFAVIELRCEEMH